MASSASSASRTRGRSASPSRAPTRWCRCSTRRSRERRAAGAREVVIGMAHRGRLNVLTHVMGKPYEALFARVRGRHPSASSESETGDVKYHMGYRAARRQVDGRRSSCVLVPNPIHLEFVEPVIDGVARATQRVAGKPCERDERRARRSPCTATRRSSARAWWPRRSTSSRLNGYRIGGTLHVIVEQPGRLHHRPDGLALDALRERPREGLRHPGGARERRRRRGVPRGGARSPRVPRRSSPRTS